MATIPYTVEPPVQTLYGHVWRVQWPAMADGDVGAVWTNPIAADRSVQVAGTFGGSTVTIQGTNEACVEPTATPTYATLHDPQGNALTFTTAGIKTVLEVSAGIRPSIAGGSGTPITVTLIVRSIL